MGVVRNNGSDRVLLSIMLGCQGGHPQFPNTPPSPREELRVRPPQERERERERESERESIYIYIYTHIPIYIYIYITL